MRGLAANEVLPNKLFFPKPGFFCISFGTSTLKRDELIKDIKLEQRAPSHPSYIADERAAAGITQEID